MLDQLPEIDDPLTGEIIDTESIDQMLDRFEALDEFNRKLYGTLLALRRAIAAKTEGDGATRRVAGRLRKAKVIMPDESFDQTKLKAAYQLFPDFREYLRIERVAIAKREYKKLLTTFTDNPDLAEFKSMLTSANQGRTGTPTIILE